MGFTKIVPYMHMMCFDSALLTSLVPLTPLLLTLPNPFSSFHALFIFVLASQ